MSGKGIRLLLRLTCFAGCLLLLPSLSLAGSVGQIKGTLIDKENGEPVVGASVSVVGTKRGAVTDFDGKFVILRLDPGKYTIRISSLEYNTVKIENIEVQIDITFELNQKLVRKVTDLDHVITVEARIKIIDKFQTNSRISITQEQIATRPVTTVEELLQQVVGVTTNSSGQIFIRGGRAGEVSFIVDGVPLDDALGGGSIQSGAQFSLVAGSIQEIQIIKDGFDPEFGNALSGIVNIRSRTGSKDITRITAQFLTDDLGNGDLNKFSRNYDFTRFSISGPDPLLTRKILPALGINWFVDKEFTYYLYAEIEKNDGLFQFDQFDSPLTRRNDGSFNLLGFSVPERLNNRYNIQANFRFRPRQNMKFVFSYKNWETRWTSFNSDIWQYRFSSATAPVNQRDQSSISLELNHSLSKDMTYEAIISYTSLSESNRPGDPRNPGHGLDPDQFLFQTETESYTDLNNNGRYDAPEPIINLFPDTASFGTNFIGPDFTNGEMLFIINSQAGGTPEFANFRFNDNGKVDDLEGEAFLDLNGNGVWDRGDILQDKNGNGLLDVDRFDLINQRTPEAFEDGDSILGEPFIDLNFNGVFDQGIDVFTLSADPSINHDLNHDGRYNGPNETWTPGIPFFDRNNNGIYDTPNNRYDQGERFVDRNGNGVYDFGGSATFLDPGTYDTDILWRERSIKTLRGEIKAFRQAGSHELKVGVSVQRDEIDFASIERPYLPFVGRDDGGLFPGRGAFRDFFQFNPIRGTIYARDKLEYGSMIASIGMRFDFFLQDTKTLAEVLRNDDRGLNIAGDRHKFSPRIGFSYPISDKAKVYFNYGHFFQLPSLVLLYQRNTASADQNKTLGNPNLDYQKTIQYSFGVKYAMSENYAIDIEGFFKDEFEKINQGRILDGTVFRNQFLNSDYARGRGLEVTLEKRGGGYVTGAASYSYAFSFGKASEEQQAFLSRIELDRTPLTEAPLDNDIRHVFKTGITVFIPNNVKPRLFGVPIPNGWSLSLESIIQSGIPFTPSSNFPGIDLGRSTEVERNSLRLPGTAIFDARFSKEFKLAGIDYDFIFWVENILNSRNIVSVYSSTGRADTQQNINQVIRGGTSFDANPFFFDKPRQIRIGIEITL